MSFVNTVKDGTGDAFWQLGNSDGEAIVEVGGMQGHSIVQVTATGNIKASAGVLYALILSWTGVTAADTVVIDDGGTTRITIRLEAAAGNLVIPLPVPATFTSSIHTTITLSGGNAYLTAVYD